MKKRVGLLAIKSEIITYDYFSACIPPGFHFHVSHTMCGVAYRTQGHVNTQRRSVALLQLHRLEQKTIDLAGTKNKLQNFHSILYGIALKFCFSCLCFHQ
jgi:hypothetical protein